MASFSERLKDLREDYNLTQPDLVDKLKSYNINTSAQNISYWEKGRQPSFDVLIALSKIFNVTVDYLIGNSNFKQVEKESYFTKDEKLLLSKINSSINLKAIEDTIIREIESFKTTLIDLFGPNDFNLQIVSSFIKTVGLLYSIYRRFNKNTEEFLCNLNSSLLVDTSLGPQEMQSRKLILQIIYTRLAELNGPTYDFSSDLSRMIEDLFTLKSDLGLAVNRISMEVLLKNIETSSSEINTLLLDEIRRDYIGDLQT